MPVAMAMDSARKRVRARPKRLTYFPLFGGRPGPEWLSYSDVEPRALARLNSSSACRL